MEGSNAVGRLPIEVGGWLGQSFAKDVEDLRFDGVPVFGGHLGVAAGQEAGAAVNDVAFVVAIPLRAAMLTAVGLDDEAGGRPVEVGLVAKERNVDGGKGEGVGSADLEDQTLESRAGLREGEWGLSKQGAEGAEAAATGGVGEEGMQARVVEEVKVVGLVEGSTEAPG